MRIANSLAANWLRNGKAVLSRSFRFHRPRGAFCHRGWCQQCKTRLPDGTVVLACRTSVAADAAAPRPSLSLLRFAGLLAERTRPWFYERQRLGGPWQQAFVKSVRWMSAANPLAPAATAAERAPTATRTCQTLIIGGGPAGVLAATELARAGRPCLVVQSGELGGSASGLLRNRDGLPWNLDVGRARFDRLEHHLCVGLYQEPNRALCVGPTGNVLVEFEELVIATGAYDRLPTVAGNDLPGIVGLRAFERLVAQGAIGGGLRVGVYAGTLEADRAVTAATRANREIAFVASPDAIAAHPRWRTHARQQLVRIEGRDRVHRVELSDGTTERCDLLVVGFSQPTYEFQAQNGCQVELTGEPPVVRARPGGHQPMLVVGEAAGPCDPKTLAAAIASKVADWLAGSAGEPPVDERVNAPAAGLRPPDAAFVCLCEDVRVGDIRAAIADGYGDIELVKRHTGAGTGPCQGKLCHAALLACMAEANGDIRIPTPRPLLRPIPLRQMAGASKTSPAVAPTN